MREAGREFLRLAREKDLGEALYQAIITCGNPSDLIAILKALTNEIKINRDRTFVENIRREWTTNFKRYNPTEQ